MTTNDSSESWPPAHCPPLAWPALSDDIERLAWYRAVIDAYAALWEGHAAQAKLAPVREDDLCALENKLGCPLPPALRTYHRELGVLSLAEELCSVTEGDRPIQPLVDAYPGIGEIAEEEADLRLAENMIVFGDYLGNGNMFCFHRETFEVYYFDHDTGDMLTRFFPSPQEYLDALMIRCLAEIYESEGCDDGGEAILIERFGEALVRKWLC